jgi:O-antigen/teichoic acid export membrane protein
MNTPTPGLKRNVLFNLVGGGWTLVLNLAVVPLQIRFLGAEVYGLIGLMSALQYILALLDFGISLTLVREIAADTSADHQESRDFVQTALTIYAGLGLCFGLILIIAAPWVAQHWLQVETLPISEVILALRLMAVTLMANWFISVFLYILMGLQRMDVVNALRVVGRSVILLGGAALLLLHVEFIPFVLWTVSTTVLSMLVHVIITLRLFKGLSLFPRLSMVALRKNWQFSIHLNLATVLSLVYTQTDTLLISKLLPLSMLGYYQIAYALGNGLATIQQYIGSAIMPAMSASYSAGDTAQVRERYLKLTQVMVYVLGIPSFILAFYGYDFLLLWAGPNTAQQASLPLAILCIGFLINSLATSSTMLAIAIKRIRPLLQVNFFGIFFYLPAIYLLIITFQLPGAASAWVIINVYYVVFLLHRVHHTIVPFNTVLWLQKTLLPFAMLSLCFVLPAQFATAQNWHGTVWVWAACAFSVVTYSVLGIYFLEKDLRLSIWRNVSRLTSSVLRIKAH